MHSDWRESPDNPPVTRSVLRWYRYRVVLFCRSTNVSPDLVDYLVDWYCDRPHRFLSYEPTETYQGPHYSMGSWLVRRDTMQAAMTEASRDVLGTVLAESGPITEASVDAALESTEPAPVEPYAGSFYSDYQTHGAFLAKHGHIEANWPRLCVACGVEFRPGHRARVRCPDCLASGRQQGKRGAK